MREANQAGAATTQGGSLYGYVVAFDKNGATEPENSIADGTTLNAPPST